jgi:hypothetical protein
MTNIRPSTTTVNRRGWKEQALRDLVGHGFLTWIDTDRLVRLWAQGAYHRPEIGLTANATHGDIRLWSTIMKAAAKRFHNWEPSDYMSVAASSRAVARNGVFETLLEKPFDFFVSVTFNSPDLKLDAARRMLGICHAAVDKRLVGSSYFKPESARSYFLGGFELGRGRQWHVHLLWRLPSKLSNLPLKAAEAKFCAAADEKLSHLWPASTIKMDRILTPLDQEKVANYMVKELATARGGGFGRDADTEIPQDRLVISTEFHR